MKRFIAVLATMALASTVLAQEIVTERIALRFARPSEITRLINEKPPTDDAPESSSLLPEGTKSVTADEADKTLVVQGTAQAIEQVKSIVRLLDVPKPRVDLRIRLVRVAFAADGTAKSTTPSAPIITSVENNMRATTRVEDQKTTWSVTVVPRINGDGSITVVGALSRREPGNVVSVSVKGSRRLGLRNTARLLGVTDSNDEAAQEQVGSGKDPQSGGAQTVWYLEVTPWAVSTALTEPHAAAQAPLAAVRPTKSWVKIPLRHVKPTELLRRWEQTGTSKRSLPSDMDPPIAYDVDRSLLVRGTAEALEQFQRLVTLWDVPVSQGGQPLRR
jgi:type II secretory pathway component GspD/PulD (secretin)